MKENKWLQQFIWFSEGVILAAIALATLFAAFMELERIIMVQVVDLSDLFLLFIYAEVLGMVGIFYRDKRIPVTLPIIIAITALTRMIVIQSKGFDGINIIYEASGILLLAVSAYIMTMKDKISLSKIKLRKEAASEENQEQ
ncbi:MAG: phosphate-starvation-inducible PsiE family protein [SAR86 cluster bacterium]|jgi:protein PsiE|nr:phosphate-starvation-inducible PsiE family protein [SAR86 cluster bacterium]|tara:strand:- start:953 stop:1378 length:426 start_codon:yes stop_codon:yes gene_type:complete